MKSSKVELCRVQRTPLRGLLLLLPLSEERGLVAVSVAASLLSEREGRGLCLLLFFSVAASLPSEERQRCLLLLMESLKVERWAKETGKAKPQLPQADKRGG